jgi:hypothetical protein
MIKYILLTFLLSSCQKGDENKTIIKAFIKQDLKMTDTTQSMDLHKQDSLNLINS